MARLYSQGTNKERFELKFEQGDPNECWLWTAHKNKLGYGGFCWRREDGTYQRDRNAHICSYELYKGTIKPGNVIRHMCNNPSCVNPNHLEQGIVQDNIDDCIRFGRKFMPIGIKHPKNKLTEEQVLEIYNTPKFKGYGRILGEEDNSHEWRS